MNGKEPTYFGKYRVIKKLGNGAFGDIYKVEDPKDQKIYAMKVAKMEKKTLIYEKNYMEQLQPSPYFPKFIEFHNEEKLEYLVMEIMGPSVREVCDNITDERFTLSTALRVGIEMLRCIRAFHEKGFVHRDIKPTNFLIRGSRKYPIALIDYGISRQHINMKTKQVIPPRVFPGFVGTRKYASVNAHEGKEQGPCDDLFSWFVSLIELTTGAVPWRTRNKIELIKMKKYVDMEKFCTFLPKQFLDIYNYIMALSYYDTPDYDLIISLLCQAMDDNNVKWTDKFDWELFSNRRLMKISSISIIPPEDEEPNIPKNIQSTKNVEIKKYQRTMSKGLLCKTTPVAQSHKAILPDPNDIDSLDSYCSVGSLRHDSEVLTMSSMCFDSSLSYSLSTTSTFTDSNQIRTSSFRVTPEDTKDSVPINKTRIKKPHVFRYRRQNFRIIHHKLHYIHKNKSRAFRHQDRKSIYSDAKPFNESMSQYSPPPPPKRSKRAREKTQFMCRRFSYV